ncbi:DNA methylase [Desulfatibacillum alkenivorans DSM 16219]|uniref:Methyltransferase n=2 Tax=Desulfatibacillum alkenivorans TaxID=259354 RepID=A0A1M7B4U9_9BACT|nr:DNA methylase [Desulfatibacillum alkenivorans DSM 16219]
MSTIMRNCNEILGGGSVIAWNIANGSKMDHISHHSCLFEEIGFQYVDTIAWIKSGANFDIKRSCHITTTGHYYPALQWEAILVYKKHGPMPKMDSQGQEYMRRFQTNVWEVTQVILQGEKFKHPAVCPVEIPYRCIQSYTKKGETVFEPFGGSGTTLIAAEMAGRSAFLMEQHPAYCDAIIQRWEQLTGKQAKLLGNISHQNGQLHSP